MIIRTDHITLEVTDSLLMKELVLMLMLPSLALLMSEYILELRPRMPMLSQVLISGVLKICILFEDTILKIL